MLLDKINRGEILLSDGAMGSLLIKRGLEIGNCFEQMNLINPGLIEDIARKYLQAGADIIHTNTFGGSALKLAGFNLETQTEEINRAAVEAAKKIAKNKAYVSGSVGPSGRLLKPYGNIEPKEMYYSFKRQIKSLIEAGVEALTIETMTDMSEAKLAIKAARDVSKDIPIMATMTFDSTPRGFYTIMGVDIKIAAEQLTAAGADIIGSNCGNGIEKMVEVAREFKKYATRPVIIQSNAGLPEIIDNCVTYSETPEFMAEACRELIDIGVSIIGGCCGTTPEHIAAMKAVIDSVRSNS